MILCILPDSFARLKHACEVYRTSRLLTTRQFQSPFAFEQQHPNFRLNRKYEHPQKDILEIQPLKRDTGCFPERPPFPGASKSGISAFLYSPPMNDPMYSSRLICSAIWFSASRFFMYCCTRFLFLPSPCGMVCLCLFLSR